MAQLSLSALLISAATTAALNDSRSPQLQEEILQEETRSALMRLVSVRSDKVDSTERAMPQGKNLRLQADIPAALQVADQQIHWSISQRDRIISKLHGGLRDIHLPVGSYTIQLTVGNYSNEKKVSIQPDQQIQPHFNIALSALQLHSNQAVDWLISGADRSYSVNAKSRLNALLPAGNYTVRALFHDFILHKKIQVKAGQQVRVALNIPIGNVRLIATRDSQPLFKTVAWDVYRLTQGKRKLVGKYHLHSRSISMPPGHYEAVARHKNNSGRRQFRVREGSTNDVILALN